MPSNSTLFVDKTTVIQADWLNDVNSATFGVNDELRVSDQAFDAVADYGMSTSNSEAQNTASLQAALVAALAVNGKVVIQAGTYKMTAGTNWALLVTFRVNGIRIEGLGQVILDYSSGSGPAFVLDCSPLSPQYLPGFCIENLMILGGAGITQGFYLNGVIRSRFKGIRVKEASSIGFKILFSVLNHFESCVCSDDLGVQTTKPDWYFRVGASADHSQNNTFTNCEAGGVGHATSTATGWYLDACSLGIWNGCTAESFATGVFIGVNSTLNQFNGVDFEDNNTYDLYCNRSNLHTFVNCYFNPSALTSADGVLAYNIYLVDSSGIVFVGGKIRSVYLDADTIGTVFNGVMFTSTFGVAGPGQYTRYGCTSGGIDYQPITPLSDFTYGPKETMFCIFANPYLDIYGNVDPAVGPPYLGTVSSGTAVLEVGVVYPGNLRQTSCKIVSAGGDTVYNGVRFNVGPQPATENTVVSVSIALYSVSLTGKAVVWLYNGSTYTRIGASTVENDWELITGTATAIAGNSLILFISCMNNAESAYVNTKTIYIGGINLVRGPNPAQTIDNSMSRQTSLVFSSTVPAYPPAFTGQRFYCTGTGQFYQAIGQTLSSDWAPISASGSSGSYVPVLTTNKTTVITTGNMASAGWVSLPTVQDDWVWYRIGDTVTVTGAISGESSASTDAFFYFTLPVASTSNLGDGFGHKTDVYGVHQLSVILYDDTPTVGFVQQVAGNSATSVGWHLQCTYLIV